MALTTLLRNILVTSGLTMAKTKQLVDSGGVYDESKLKQAGVSTSVAKSIINTINNANTIKYYTDTNIVDIQPMEKQVLSPESFLSTPDGVLSDAKLRNDMNIRYRKKDHVELYYDRLYSIYPDLELNGVCQYVFIVRPDTNIIKNNTKKSLVGVTQTQKNQGYASNSSCDSDQFMQYMNKHHNNILRHLTSELTSNNDFMPYLVGRTESLQIPDYGVKNYYVTQPFTGLSLPYAGHALESMSGNGGTFEITFREDNELKVHKLFQAWLHYIDGVTRNLFLPKDKHIRQNKIDYATSVYCITCKPDAESIIHWAKYTGAFPLSVPNSDLSFNLRGPINNKVSIPFAYFFVETMDPLLLIDFNINAHVSNDILESGSRVKDSIPVYNTSKLKDYQFNISDKSIKNDSAVLGTGYGLVGAPFIYRDSTTKLYKLGWKNPYN